MMAHVSKNLERIVGNTEVSAAWLNKHLERAEGPASTSKDQCEYSQPLPGVKKNSREGESDRHRSAKEPVSSDQSAQPSGVAEQRSSERESYDAKDRYLDCSYRR
jgi:hypothetical protein